MLSNGHLIWVCAVAVVLCEAKIEGIHRSSTSNMDSCKILCKGKLLKHVQMARLFNDSKLFVDMKLKESPEIIERKFQTLLNQTKNQPPRQQLMKFVKDNFEDPGQELSSWVPEDWKPMPKFTYDVYDLPLRNWVREVNEKWKLLGRKMSVDVKDSSYLYTQIYIPNPFVIPGGRFIEVYYWDSYFIIEGLLLSEMFDTARGMIENFIYLVDQFGYVPNGSRKYYLGRSQPPLLIAMVNLYFEATKDVSFLNQSMGALEREYRFWQNNRSIDVKVEDKTYKLYQFKVTTTEPRPESYYEDEEQVKGIKDEKQRVKMFSEIQSAAESGWDFSSRWFLANGEHTAEFKDISILSIAPVCLNSIMGLNAKLLARFSKILGNKTKLEFYENLAQESSLTMSRIFWSDRDGVWLDYNIEKKKLIPGFYPSNLIPLWAETFGEERTPGFITEQVVAYLDRNHISKFIGGIPASLLESGQQWDMPNNWAPSQYFIVMGLYKARKHSPRAEELAFTLARDWVRNVYETYMNSTPHTIYEKYNASAIGKIGEGGEYETQEGFGWTNGVLMKFLSIYGHKIRTKDVYDPAPLAIGVVLMLVSIMSVVSYMYRVRVCHRKRCEPEAEPVMP